MRQGSGQCIVAQVESRKELKDGRWEVTLAGSQRLLCPVTLVMDGLTAAELPPGKDVTIRCDWWVEIDEEKMEPQTIHHPAAAIFKAEIHPGAGSLGPAFPPMTVSCPRLECKRSFPVEQQYMLSPVDATGVLVQCPFCHQMFLAEFPDMDDLNRLTMEQAGAGPAGETGPKVIDTGHSKVAVTSTWSMGDFQLDLTDAEIIGGEAGPCSGTFQGCKRIATNEPVCRQIASAGHQVPCTCFMEHVGCAVPF